MEEYLDTPTKVIIIIIMAEEHGAMMTMSTLAQTSTSSALQEALLIKAQSRIVDLENEVSKLRQEASVQRVKQDLTALATRSLGITDVEREHKVPKW